MVAVKHGLPVLAALTAYVVSADAARADQEAWAWIEYRLPVAAADRALPRIRWRLWTDVRGDRRSGGLHQIFFRTGPLVDVTPWLLLGIHGTVYADRLATGAFDQEARAEIEPNLHRRFGPFGINDRNRIEYRWRESGVRYRYRNQLRLTYTPDGARWLPFAWDEVLVDLSGLGLNQNRAMAGVGRTLGPLSRVDVGVMLRSRQETGRWLHDQVLAVSLFVDAPP